MTGFDIEAEDIGPAPDEFEDEFEHYEELYNPSGPPRKANHKPKKAQSQVIAEIADPAGLEDGFRTTYKPSRHEADWLLSSLRSFYDQHLITDVLGQVKGGKEASVYRCAADPSAGHTLLAAKVYRPRKFRSLRNDKMYQQGRPVLTEAGRPAKKTDHRLMRALGKKTAFGQQVQHTSWLMYEYTTLERLFQAGGAVPRPVAAAENALLMGYEGDAEVAAPALNEIALDPEEAGPLFEEVVRNIELMLAHGLIHGDLSAYNILYWDGRVTLIDFPQVASRDSNPQAEFLLRRDITRVCDYFTRQGVACDPDSLMAKLGQL